MNLALLLILLLLSSCSTKADKKSDLPVYQFCFFASCTVQTSEKGAAQDEVAGDIDANFMETNEQSSTNETKLEAKLK